MFVCEHCLQAIESHEGNQWNRKVSYLDDVEIVYGDYDDDGNFIEDMDSLDEYMKCEWCEEYIPRDEMYEI